MVSGVLWGFFGWFGFFFAGGERAGWERQGRGSISIV